MERSIQKYLVEWKDKPHRKPLIIRGARQVGKSYLVRGFAREHFSQLVEINFETHPTLKELFTGKSPQKIIELLELQFQTKILPENTLLFLDEIQAAPDVIPTLRYFYEEMPKMAIVAAGSLLEFTLSDHAFSMPVGRIEYMHMGPMNFEEFLLAAGQERLKNFLDRFELSQDIPTPVHEQLLEWVKIFILVGGMPEAIKVYLNTKSWKETEAVKHNILATYQDDFVKYGKKINYLRLKRVFQKIPHLIGEKTKYVSIDPHERAKDLAFDINLLCMARICCRVCHTSANGIPLGAERNDKVFKLIFLDVGLVNSLCGFNLLDFERAQDIQLVNQGKISEQFIGQQLAYLLPHYQEPELYYWVREKQGSSAEVDYITSRGQKIIPVEIKSGKTGQLKSLHQFLREKKLDMSVRFNSQRPSVLTTKTSLIDHNIPFTLISLPFYLINQFNRLVRSFL